MKELLLMYIIIQFLYTLYMFNCYDNITFSVYNFIKIKNI